MFFALVLLFLPSFVLATDYSSDSFKVKDPVFQIGGQKATSTSFQLFGSIGQISIGTSTANSFKDFAGFWYFPYVTTPVVIATAGNAQVSLSWTLASAGVGWSVSGYSVGKSTTTGGPYTYTNVGNNVLSSSQTGLTNGTTYYFVVRVLDGIGNSIATSTQAWATPAASAVTCGNGSCSGGETCSSCPTDCGACPSGGGGGGGGGVILPAGGTVNFFGRAYPGSAVTLLKDAQIAVKTIAGPDSNFSISLVGLSAGNFIFSIYGEDKENRRSTLFSFTVSISANSSTNVTGIFIAPTIAVDKSEVKRGDNIAIFGQTASQSEVTIIVSSDEEYFAKMKSDKDGVYLYNFDTSPLDFGDHSTKSKAALSGSVSSFSSIILFEVGTKNVLAPKITEKKS